LKFGVLIAPASAGVQDEVTPTVVRMLVGTIRRTVERHGLVDTTVKLGPAPLDPAIDIIDDATEYVAPFSLSPVDYDTLFVVLGRMLQECATKGHRLQVTILGYGEYVSDEESSARVRARADAQKAEGIAAANVWRAKQPKGVNDNGIR